jgi:hypothetical protein
MVAIANRVGMEPPPPPQKGKLGGVVRISNEHYEALDRAREYFGINKKEFGDRADHYLALAMALVLFGKNTRGRAKGTKTWTEERLLEFADAFWVLKEKNAALSDSEICRRLGKGGDHDSSFKHYDPDNLRKLLPDAKRAVREYFEDTEQGRDD